MKRQTVKEWMEEGKKLFGDDLKKWRFKCPACGHVATGQQFKDLGADPNQMYSNCIGRLDKENGCNWAAYGLLGTLCKGRIIDNDGKQTEVFDFDN